MTLKAFEAIQAVIDDYKVKTIQIETSVKSVFDSDTDMTYVLFVAILEDMQFRLRAGAGINVTITYDKTRKACTIIVDMQDNANSKQSIAQLLAAIPQNAWYRCDKLIAGSFRRWFVVPIANLPLDDASHAYSFSYCPNDECILITHNLLQ